MHDVKSETRWTRNPLQSINLQNVVVQLYISAICCTRCSPPTAAIVNAKGLKKFVQIGHIVFTLCAFFTFPGKRLWNWLSRSINIVGIFSLKVALDETWIQTEIVQIGPLLLELSAFLYFSWWMTAKVNEFPGYVSLESSPYECTSQKKRRSNSHHSCLSHLHFWTFPGWPRNWCSRSTNFVDIFSCKEALTKRHKS
jgi:hypothetical protein